MPMTIRDVDWSSNTTRCDLTHKRETMHDTIHSTQPYHINEDFDRPISHDKSQHNTLCISKHYRSKGDIRRARIAKSVRFSHENIVHRYCPEYHQNSPHKSPKHKSNRRSTPVLRDTTNMTTRAALQKLELAEARKRKAEESAKGKQKTTTKKKSNLKRNTDATDQSLGPSNASRQTSTHSADLTNVQMDDSTSRKNKVFYTIKLHSNGGPEPLKVLQRTLRDWLRTMQSCVSSIILCNTATNSDLAITKPEQISTNLQSIKKFFNGICPRTGAGDIWFTVLLGYNDDDDELLENTRWWFQDNKGVMYRKALQVLDTSRKLWLLYSHEKMNLTSLKNAMDEFIATKHYPSIPFALTNSNIRDGTKFNSKTKGAKQVKAIHVEVASLDTNRIKTLFSQLYGSSATTFLLQIRMRYVLAVKNSTDSKTKNQILALRNKQDWFLSSVTHAQTWEIATLDKITNPNTKSLRTLLMNIKTKDKKSNLFLSVNEDARGDGIFFTFPTALKTEARDMISYFGTFLAYEHKDGDIYKYLKPDAAKRAKESSWDPLTHEAVTKENKALDRLMAETEKIDWLQDPSKSTAVEFLQDPSITEQTKQHLHEAFLFSQDVGSVKTFNPNSARNDDTNDITVDPDDDQNDMSEVTGLSNGVSVSTKASKVLAAYHGMKRMMIGLERMLNSQDQAHNNSGVKAGNPSLSAQTPSPPGVMGQT